MLLILKMLVINPDIPIGKPMSPVDNLLLIAMVHLAEDLASTPPSEQLSQPDQGSAQLVTAVARLILLTFRVGMEGYLQHQVDLNDRKRYLPLDLLRCFSVLTPSQQEAAAAEIGSSGEPSAVHCPTACTALWILIKAFGAWAC